MNFETAFARLMEAEGGLVNNPLDPGQETKYGVSKRSYPNVDIKNLTREGAAAIYRRDFWDCCGKDLHPSVMFQVFDAAVNHGAGNAIRMLQRAIGVTPDGDFGPNSRAHYAGMDENDILFLFLAERGEFMASLKKFDTFGRGWVRRVFTNLRYAAEDN